jgi:hypothetical protein
MQTSATVAMERLPPSGTRGDAVEGRLLGETLGHRRGQRARSCSARRRHSVWPYNTLTPDGQASPPTGRERGHRGRRTRPGRGGTHEPAIWDGAAPPQAQSGGGPGAGCLADTGRGNGRWVCRKLQRPEDVPAHLTVRDGGDDAQHPLRTPGAARHLQCKHPLVHRRAVLAHVLHAYRAPRCGVPGSTSHAAGRAHCQPPAEGAGRRPVASTTQRVHSRRDCGTIAYEIPSMLPLLSSPFTHFFLPSLLFFKGCVI